MEIIVTGKFLQPFKGNKVVEASLGYRGDEKEKCRLDVTSLDDATLSKMYDVLEKSKDQKEKLAANTIKLYRETLKNPLSTQPKTLQHLVQCLRGYINGGPHLTMFSLDDYDEQWLPYVVTKVNYVPRDGRDNPAHTDVYFSYYNSETVNKTSVSFHQNELYHKDVAEMMRLKGYLLETPELMAKYEESVKNYQKLVGQTGLRVDGYKYGKPYGRYNWGRTILETDGKPASLVIDDSNEDEEGNVKESTRHNPVIDSTFWGRSNFGNDADPKKMSKKAKPDDDDDENGLSAYFESSTNLTEENVLRVPIHPYIGCFDLKRHQWTNVHASNLKPYIYDEKIGEKLVLPSNSHELIGVLIESASGQFEDIIKGKSGGSVILCAGSPGTGKTLTAEVYAEVMKRPLYTVQCSQLGVDFNTLEKELVKTMRRAMRWKAILLIDEADVYIHDRGSDVNQNAIVGIFLRVLEYYNGVMFLTTNRVDDIDDAVASRATAKVVYQKPTSQEQIKLWTILSKGSAVDITGAAITSIVEKHSDLSGRDIKNLLKLATMLAKKRGEKEITLDLVTYVRQFKQA